MDYLSPFLDALSQGTQVVQNLRQAAMQQQQLDERKRQADMENSYRQAELNLRDRLAKQSQDQMQFKNSMDLLTSGAQPVNADGGVTQAVQTPDAPLASSINAGGVTLPGAGVTIPGQTMNSNIPVDQSRVVQSGGKGYYVPTLDESAKSELGRRLTAASAADQDKLDRYGVNLPDALLKEFQITSGTKMLPEDVERLSKVHEAIAPAPDPKAPSLQKDGYTADGRPITFDPSTGKRTVGDRIAGMAAPAGGAGGQTANSQAVDRRQATKEASSAAMDEQDAYARAKRLSTAILGGKLYFPKTGAPKSMTDAPDDETRQAYIDDMMEQYNSAINDAKGAIARKNEAYSNIGVTPKVSTEQAHAALEQGRQKFLDRYTGKSGGAQAATAPAAKPSTGKGSIDRNTAAGYMQKAGGDPKKARELAKADGWTF